MMSGTRAIARTAAATAGLADGWVIEPRQPGISARLQEAWRYRRLLPFFADRSMHKLYRNTVLGKVWIVLRPLVTLLLTVWVFGSVMGMKSGETPYLLFVLVSSSCWSLFETSLMWATRSIQINRKMVRSLYFPRILLPVAGTAPAFVELLLCLSAVFVAATYYHLRLGIWYVSFGPNLLVALGALVLAWMLAVSIGLWTSVLAARARDVRFVLSYVLRFWMFLTPIVYPLSQVPERYRLLISLNPMTPIVEHFKWGILGIGEVDLKLLGLSCLTILALGAAGLTWFDRAEAESMDSM